MDALEDKKAEDILLLDLRDVAPFTDYFVICSGTSERMLNALLKGATEAVKKSHKRNARVEGNPMDGWMLADFGDVVLHVFSEAQRDYYLLEELWSDGKVLVRVQ